jgi:transcription antitermination factor NusG
MNCVSSQPSGLTSNWVPSMNQDLRWHAVYTYPRHEKAVAGELQSRSIEVFLPTTVVRSRWKDRTVQLHTPVFPGYVFTRITSSQRSRVLCAAGVIRLLSFNGMPAPIDDAEIEAVKLCLERGATLAPLASFELGDRVRVRSGVLQGLEGRISRCKNERRLIVPITLIHQSIAVEVDVALLEPLDARR